MYRGNQASKQASIEQRLKRVEEISEHAFNFIGKILMREAEYAQRGLKDIRKEIANIKKNRNKKFKPKKRLTLFKKK